MKLPQQNINLKFHKHPTKNKLKKKKKRKERRVPVCQEWQGQASQSPQASSISSQQREGRGHQWPPRGCPCQLPWRGQSWECRHTERVPCWRRQPRRPIGTPWCGVPLPVLSRRKGSSTSSRSASPRHSAKKHENGVVWSQSLQIGSVPKKGRCGNLVFCLSIELVAFLPCLVWLWSWRRNRPHALWPPLSSWCIRRWDVELAVEMEKWLYRSLSVHVQCWGLWRGKKKKQGDR